MIDTLRYGLDDTLRMTLDVPQEVFDTTVSETRLGEILERPEGLVTAELQEGGTHLVFADQAFKGLNDRVDSQTIDAYASQWLYAFVKLKDHTPEELRDPRMDIHMSIGPSHDDSGMSRRGVHAELQWPLKDYSLAQQRATLAMQHTALTLRVMPKSIINGVYGVASYEDGVYLTALDIGACCLLTEGMDYRHEREKGKVELTGTNLYNRRLVLTCLSGLIALAEQT